jgi:hypothetical protein
MYKTVIEAKFSHHTAFKVHLGTNPTTLPVLQGVDGAGFAEEGGR